MGAVLVLLTQELLAREGKPPTTQQVLQSRGIRNNNPGNIRVGVLFDGIATPGQRTPVQKTEKEFSVFISPEMGLRALTRNFLTSNKKNGRDTVRKMITRFAPPSENDTEAYIKKVAGAVGIASDVPVDLTDPNTMLSFLKAVITHENGTQPFTDEMILEGMSLEGSF